MNKMANRKAEVYSNFHRVLILSLIKDRGEKGFTISDLSRKINLSHRSIRHHLNWLENRKLVTPIPQPHTLHNPVIYIATKQADPIPLNVLKWAKFMFRYGKNLKEEAFSSESKPSQKEEMTLTIQGIKEESPKIHKKIISK